MTVVIFIDKLTVIFLNFTNNSNVTTKTLKSTKFVCKRVVRKNIKRK